MSWITEVIADAPRDTVICSRIIVASIPAHVERSGVFAIWPFSRASLMRCGVGCLGLLRLVGGHGSGSGRAQWPSGATASRTRLPSAGEISGSASATTIERDHDAQREGEREHVEVRRGAREQSERDLGEEQAAEDRARDLDRGDEELPQVLGEHLREIVRIERPPAGITSNERKKPFTRMRYALRREQQRDRDELVEAAEDRGLRLLNGS